MDIKAADETSHSQLYISDFARRRSSKNDVHLLTFIVEIGIDGGDLRSRRLGMHMAHYVTSSTKPEVHTISQPRRRRTEPRPQAAYTIGEVRVVSEICALTKK